MHGECGSILDRFQHLRVPYTPASTTKTSIFSAQPSRRPVLPLAASSIVAKHASSLHDLAVHPSHSFIPPTLCSPHWCLLLFQLSWSHHTLPTHLPLSQSNSLPLFAYLVTLLDLLQLISRLGYVLSVKSIL